MLTEAGTADMPPPVAMQRSVGHGSVSLKPGADGRTRLAGLHQKANAKIRIPRQHAARLEAVLINTAGGLTGGDRLDWRIEAGPDTHGVVATQACERIYKASDGAAHQAATIIVADGARLDWLPQETILFDRGALDRSLAVDLAPTASFIGLETIVLGRHAMGETVRSSRLRDRWRIRRNGRLVHADDVRLDGDIAGLRGHPALLGDCAAVATILACLPVDDDQWAALAAELREAVARHMPVRAGVSCFAGKGIVRLMAATSYDLRPAVIDALSVLRGGIALPAVWRS